MPLTTLTGVAGSLGGGATTGVKVIDKLGDGLGAIMASSGTLEMTSSKMLCTAFVAPSKGAARSSSIILPTIAAGSTDRLLGIASKGLWSVLAVSWPCPAAGFSSGPFPTKAVNACIKSPMF